MALDLFGKGAEEEQVKIQREMLHVMKRILRKLSPHVEYFNFQQSGDTMNQPFPGETLQFTLTDEPVGSALPEGIVPTWTSSDPLAAVTADPTGTIGTVVLDPSIAVGDAVVITASATFADGKTATGSVTINVVAAPIAEPTSFELTQTA